MILGVNPLEDLFTAAETFASNGFENDATNFSKNEIDIALR